MHKIFYNNSMSIFYKKILKQMLLIPLILCICPICFAETRQNVSIITVGGSITNQYPAGDMASFADYSLGLGLDARFRLPVDLPVLDNLGFSARGQWQMLLPSDSRISHLYTTSLTAGIYYVIPFENTQVSLQPEIGYGIAVHSLKTSDGLPEYPEGTYLDQMIEFSVAAVYSASTQNNGTVNFTFAPVYTLMPEQDSLVHLIGFRLGFSYGFPRSAK